ncbi:MAG: glycerophosphodiester phosphodiesterase family protein [Clostridia bacterium]|nr:glycerophosphodiester phosphodiesterase family protein [Clostridia bacterium]
MKKATSLLLVLLALVLLLCACSGPADNSGDTDGNDSNTANTTPADTTSVPATYISLNDYAVVRADTMEKATISAASDMCVKLGKLLGKTIRMSSDWIKGFEDDPTVENDEYEILIGATNRKESKEVLAEFSGDSDFAIRVVGKKIVIAGKSDSATLLALERFSELCLSGETPQVAENLNVVHAPSVAGSAAYILATEYTAIRPADGGEYSVSTITALRDALKEITGQTVAIAVDDVKASVPASGYVSTDKEILLGVTNRAESIAAAETIGAMDYTISITENKVIICGGTPLSTLRAIDRFAECLRTGELNSLEAGSFTYTEVFTDLYSYNPLCYDSSSFVPDWSDKYSYPDWMLDFEEKTYAITQNNLRNMSMSHRSDLVYYPENSIEGILSAILCGIDSVEVDVSITKDHVLVLMHDLTLKRTTDFSAKAGKNGLPTSEYIYDWTYEELQQLCLKTNSGKQTEYKIPTLYEAMMVMKDRCFIHLDQKIAVMPTPRTLTANDEVFAMADEIGCKEIFFYDYGLNTMKTWYSMNRSDADFSAFVNKISGYLKNGAIRKRYWCFGDAEVGATNTSYETVANWEKLRNEGKTLLWTNSPHKYTQYIAENFSPATP